MGWILAFIILVAAVFFWRASLPIVVVLGLAIGGYLLYMHKQEAATERSEQTAAEALQEMVVEAQKSATAKGKAWQLIAKKDPASGRMIARGASKQSDDGLCLLQIEQRLDGTEVTELRCPGISISEYEDINVKFDTSAVSQSMNLESYGDSEEVYITEYQPTYKRHMPYDQFTRGLTRAGAVSIEIPAIHKFWTRFTLTGSTEAISQLGKEMPAPAE